VQSAQADIVCLLQRIHSPVQGRGPGSMGLRAGAASLVALSGLQQHAYPACRSTHVIPMDPGQDDASVPPLPVGITQSVWRILQSLLSL
jgi:hypothetical protein